MVRLQSLIQDGLIWRNDVIVYDRSTNTQAFIQLEPEKNRFLVTLRGSDRTKCCQLMDRVIAEVTAALAQHPSITMKQQIRSPHDPEAAIDLDEAIADAKAPNDNERVLSCPSTRLPIKAESLLVAAGLENRGSTPQKSSLLSLVLALSVSPFNLLLPIHNEKIGIHGISPSRLTK